MKCSEGSIRLVSFILLFGLNTSADGTHRFPFIDETLNVKEYPFLSMLSMEDIVRELREKYGLKIMFLDRMAESACATCPSLIPLNDVRDEASIRYYTEDKKKETVFSRSSTAIGVFLAPYLKPYQHEDEISLDPIHLRPNYEQPLALLVSNADRHVLLHEAMHFLVYRARRERGAAEIEDCKRRYARFDGIWLKHRRTFRINRDLANEWEASLGVKREQMRPRLLDAEMTYARFTLEVLLLGPGEEADVSRFLYENRKKFFLKPEEAEFALDYFEMNLRDLKNNLENLAHYGNIQGILGQPGLEEKLSALNQDAVKKFRRVQSLVAENEMWLAKERALNRKK